MHKLSESLNGYVTILSSMGALVGYQPGEDVFVGIEPTLLISDVIALAALLIELSKTICSMLEGVLKGFKMHFS